MYVFYIYIYVHVEKQLKSLFHIFIFQGMTFLMARAFFGVLQFGFMWYVYRELAYIHSIQLLLSQVNLLAFFVVCCTYVTRFDRNPSVSD